MPSSLHRGSRIASTVYLVVLVDLDAGTVEVRRTLASIKGGVAVFPDPWGRPIRRWTLTRHSFTPLLERAGLPGAITFHGLRHTSATLMFGAGVPAKVVQERLGHTDVALTLNVYSHVLPNMQWKRPRRSTSC